MRLAFIMTHFVGDFSFSFLLRLLFYYFFLMFQNGHSNKYMQKTNPLFDRENCTQRIWTTRAYLNHRILAFCSKVTGCYLMVIRFVFNTSSYIKANGKLTISHDETRLYPLFTSKKNNLKQFLFILGILLNCTLRRVAFEFQ